MKINYEIMMLEIIRIAGNKADIITENLAEFTHFVKGLEAKGMADEDDYNELVTLAKYREKEILWKQDVHVGKGVTVYLRHIGYPATIIEVDGDTIKVQRDRAYTNPAFERLDPMIFTEQDTPDGDEPDCLYERDPAGEVTTFRWSEADRKYIGQHAIKITGGRSQPFIRRNTIEGI